ncbi:MAG: 30S ribosomal protein S3 [Candidatus Pacebacteria bacterium]|nr:30S ribosomal protein S3 [Candidatus Paceibacterota bacterium]
MTHTVHPYAHRLGIIRDWKSRWFSNSKAGYRNNLKIDTSVREFLTKKLRGMYIDTVEIERDRTELRVTIKTSRPGMIIGREGDGSKKLQQEVEKVVRKALANTGTDIPKIKLDIVEVRSPESRAAIVAYMIAEGLEKRQPFRRVMKQTIEKVMANRDVLGVRIRVSGRLGGADMARSEEVRKGRVPLQTLRADIDYAKEYALDTYGKIGIKVWIYRGEIFEEDATNNMNK